MPYGPVTLPKTPVFTCSVGPTLVGDATIPLPTCKCLVGRTTFSVCNTGTFDPGNSGSGFVWPPNTTTFPDSFFGVVGTQFPNWSGLPPPPGNSLRG